MIIIRPVPYRLPPPPSLRFDKHGDDASWKESECPMPTIFSHSLAIAPQKNNTYFIKTQKIWNLCNIE